MTILPRLINIPPKKVMFTPKYVDLRALSSVVANRIYALFVVKSTRVPRLGGGEGGSSQSWQCQDFHGFCYSHPSFTEKGNSLVKVATTIYICKSFQNYHSLLLSLRFFISGWLLNKRRLSLSGESLTMQLFLNDNLSSVFCVCFWTAFTKEVEIYRNISDALVRLRSDHKYFSISQH